MQWCERVPLHACCASAELLLCACELVLSVNLPPPSPSLLCLVLLKQQTAWAHTNTLSHTHTHTNPEQPWSQADRDRDRLGEVERTAWGCLQTTGNTPPSHETYRSKSQKTLLKPPHLYANAAVQLLSVTHPCNCSNRSHFCALHSSTDPGFVLFPLSNTCIRLLPFVQHHHQSCMKKTFASAV